MSVPAAALIADRPGQRLIFIDALRVTIVAFVIIHHAAQAYGPTGGFWPIHDKAQSDWFAPFYTVNSAFGLALLFLIAGYFVPPACERKGTRRFLRERWVRLGIPLMSWIVLVQLPALYLLGARPPALEFIHRLYDQGWQPLYAHLWFVAHLLLYSTVYVVWRRLFARPGKTTGRRPIPNSAAIAGFVLVLALATSIVRLRYPVDKWVPLFWILPAEPAHLPQYVALFAAGVAAYRNDWFRQMPASTGMVWLAIGLIVSAAIYAAHLGGPLSKLMATGGLDLSSLARSAWETTLACALSIGLVVAFREIFTRPSRLIVAAAAASFAAYIVHPPIVVALQAAMSGAMLAAVVKFSVVSVLAVAISFGLAKLAGKVPGLRIIVGSSS